MLPSGCGDGLSRSCRLIIAHHPLLFRLCRRSSGHTGTADRSITGGPRSDRGAPTLAEEVPPGYMGRCADRQKVVELWPPYCLPMLIGLLLYIKEKLGALGCRVNRDQDSKIRRLAVFPGSFDEDNLPFLEQMEIDALLCGELKHHLALQLAARGITAIDAGHDVTERVVLRPLSVRLARLLPGITFAVHEGLDYNRVAFRVNQATAGDDRKATREESPGSIG